MVNPISTCAALLLLGPGIALAEEPLAKEMPAEVRGSLWVALFAIVIVGLTLALLVAMGGRYVRRLARHRIPPTTTDEESWYRKPVTPEPDEDFDA